LLGFGVGAGVGAMTQTSPLTLHGKVSLHPPSPPPLVDVVDLVDAVVDLVDPFVDLVDSVVDLVDPVVDLVGPFDVVEAVSLTTDRQMITKKRQRLSVTFMIEI